MANYNISKKAKADLDNIYEYGLLKFGEAQADTYHFEIYEQFQFIANRPGIYPKSDLEKFRRCVFRVHSIYYLVNLDGAVSIVRVLGRQDHRQEFG